MAFPDYRRAPPTALPWHAAAALLCLAFVAMQATTLGYGTTVNDLPHIARYKVAPGAVTGEVLQRRNLIMVGSGVAETLDKWMMRFKLYSVEPDDIVSVMALARIKPGELKLDPGFYQYGGAYLYPLGGWYFALSKLGLVKLGPFATLLAEPQRVDAVYIFGRLFVLLTFALSAFFLWRTLALVAPPPLALIATAIYILAPATIMFSQIMKPHWYGLLWANFAMLIMARLCVRRAWSRGAVVGLGIATGLAVGTAATFALFAVFIWLALVDAARRGYARWPALLTVPAVAVLSYLVSNPYLAINFSSAAAERSWTFENWLTVSLSPTLVAEFVSNSLLPALGIALTVVLLAAALFRFVRPARPMERGFALAILATVLAGAALTSAQAQWHVNLRYTPYLLSGGLIFLALALGRHGASILSAVFALTVMQAIPMLLAYRDADDPAHSTRLQAARWIEHNIPPGSAIWVGTGTPGPFNVPPFDLTRYRINANDPAYSVIVHIERPRETPAGQSLAMRFRPRFGTDRFPLVIGFANPTISVYRRMP